MDLIINRKMQYFDLVRNYKIFINDKEVGKVGSKSSLTVNNLNGELKVSATIDWCRSNEIIIKADSNLDNYKLTIKNRNSYVNTIIGLSMFFSFLIRIFWPEIKALHYLSGGLIAIMLVGIIYNLILNKNNYLLLEPETN